MEIFYDKTIFLDLWKNTWDIIKCVGTTEWEKYTIKTLTK